MSTKLNINEADIVEYEEAGAICLRGLFSAEWIERLSEAVDKWLIADDKTGEFQLGHTLAHQDPVFREFTMHSPAAEIAKTIMRSQKIQYYFDQLFVKEPGVQNPTPWHQDKSYWPVVGRQVCSVWIPCDPITKANSGLEYVRGSHNWKEYAPAPFTENSKKLDIFNTTKEKLPDFDNRRDEFDFLCWDMQPGDCLIHNLGTVHGASGNTTRENRRRAFAIRWLGDDARYREPDQGSVDPNLIDHSLRTGDPMDSLKFPHMQITG